MRRRTHASRSEPGRGGSTMDAADACPRLRCPPAGERPGRALPALPAPARPRGRPARRGRRESGGRRPARPPAGRAAVVPALGHPRRPWTRRSGRSPASCSATARPTAARPGPARSEEMPDLGGRRRRATSSSARSPAAAWAPSSRAATSTSAATWPSRCSCEEHRDSPEMVRRFVEEAQIGGQLQHPGIVPVYELGRLPRRPAVHRDEAGPGPHPGRAAGRPRRTPADGPAAVPRRSSSRSARRWPTPTRGA